MPSKSSIPILLILVILIAGCGGQTKDGGIFSIILGLLLLIGQLFIKSNKNRKPGWFTPRQQKTRMIIGGIGIILIGLIILLIWKK